MHKPKWSMFFDFHTMPACPDVGKNFDAEAVTDHLRECGVDYVVFPARCNLGVAYYDTRVGIRHPSLAYDLFGRLAEACQRKGIALSAYVNVGLSHEEGSRRRDWLILSPEGHAYEPDRLDHFFRCMCYNSGYAEHLLAMIREIVAGYPVAGLFLDCMHAKPCVGRECVREMKESGLDWSSADARARFAYESRTRMARRIAETANAIREGLLLYFNGMPVEEQKEIGTYIELECLPTGGWGYDVFPTWARYLRKHGKTVLNMTGRFHESWGDFGGIRTEASLEYDLLHGLANGLPPTVGDHFHPRGDINRPVFDLVKRIYTRLRRLEPWVDGAIPLVDAAVVAPPGWGKHDAEALARSKNAAIGATRMLCEEKAQFDVLTEGLDCRGYRLLVLPDHVVLDEALAAKVRHHLDAGGKVIASAWSGLDPDKKAFRLPDWDVRYTGDSPYDPAYLQVTDDRARPGVPDMPVALYERGAAVSAGKGTDVLARIVAPFFNRHWDGEQGFLYLPPDRLTDSPALTCTKQVGYFTHPVFTAYHKHAQVPMRQLLANLLRMLLPEPLMQTEGLPSFARATVTGQPGRRMAHLLSYVPERRGETISMIEEPIVLREVVVRLRLDGRPPARVYLAPDRRKLPFRVGDNYIQTTVPEVSGYALVVFEEHGA